MNKLMEILIYILAVIGLACIVKHIHIMPCNKGCYLCGWQKIKVEEKEEHGEGEKRTGSRYGSNPIQY